jgi:hypothetical protein
MVKRWVDPSHKGDTSEYSDELQGSKYSILRDEMLWRRYNNAKVLNEPVGVNSSLRILSVIRNAPE